MTRSVKHRFFLGPMPNPRGRHSRNALKTWCRKVAGVARETQSIEAAQCRSAGKGGNQEAKLANTEPEKVRFQENQKTRPQGVKRRFPCGFSLTANPFRALTPVFPEFHASPGRVALGFHVGGVHRLGGLRAGSVEAEGLVDHRHVLTARGF